MDQDQITNKEISTTTRWGIGIIIAIISQSMAFVWFLSDLNSKAVETDKIARMNAQSIASLQQGASVILTREQLDDILSSRDARLDNIERALVRIEGKL